MGDEQNYLGFDRMRSWRFKNLALLLDGNNGNHWPTFENPVYMAERVARDFDWYVNNHTAWLGYILETPEEAEARDAERSDYIRNVELGPYGLEWQRERGWL